MALIEKECPVCTKTYLADTGRLKHGRQTTCSRTCSYLFRAKAISKSVLRFCATCGKEINRPVSQVVDVKYGAVYCSRACHYQGRSQGLTKRVVSRPYVYTETSKAAMLAASRRPKGKRVFHSKTCCNCKSLFDDLNNRIRKSGLIFCSLACCNSYRKGEYNPAWRGGHPKYYGPDWRPARLVARRRDNYTCRRCGKHTKRAPDVHHIKPVSSFENVNDANYLENLVCLCHTCHMIVEWHGIDFSL